MSTTIILVAAATIVIAIVVVVTIVVIAQQTKALGLRRLEKGLRLRGLEKEIEEKKQNNNTAVVSLIRSSTTDDALYARIQEKKEEMLETKTASTNEHKEGLCIGALSALDDLEQTLREAETAAQKFEGLSLIEKDEAWEELLCVAKKINSAQRKALIAYAKAKGIAIE